MKRPPKQSLFLGLSVFTAFLLIAGGFRWRTEQTNRAALESRRADFAQCIAINQNREDTRIAVQSTYVLVSSVLRTGGPGSRELTIVFKSVERKLARKLTALKPLDCLTYVRPDLPPDAGTLSSR